MLDDRHYHVKDDLQDTANELLRNLFLNLVSSTYEETI